MNQLQAKAFPIIIFFLLILHSSCVIAVSRTGNYTIFSEDHESLGELKVTSEETDSTTTISVTAQFIAKLIVSVDVRYSLKSIYHNGHLYSNQIVTYRDNSINSVVRTMRSGSDYAFWKDDKERTYTREITFAESLLYFNEPVNKSAIYSEFDGIDKPISQVKPGHFRMANPENGHISEYFYEGGILQKAIVQVAFIPLTFERNK